MGRMRHNKESEGLEMEGGTMARSGRGVLLIAERHGDPINKALVHSENLMEITSMNLIIRKTSIHWKSGAPGGIGTLTTGSGVLKEAKLSLGLSPQEAVHTDSAELIAAAHASSFFLALANDLQLRVIPSGEIITTATVTMEPLGTEGAMKNIHLNVLAKLPNVTHIRFIEAMVRSKTNSGVSQLPLGNVSMNAKLER